MEISSKWQYFRFSKAQPYPILAVAETVDRTGSIISDSIEFPQKHESGYGVQHSKKFSVFLP